MVISLFYFRGTNVRHILMSTKNIRHQCRPCRDYIRFLPFACPLLAPLCPLMASRLAGGRGLLSGPAPRLPQSPGMLLRKTPMLPEKTGMLPVFTASIRVARCGLRLFRALPSEVSEGGAGFRAIGVATRLGWLWRSTCGVKMPGLGSGGLGRLVFLTKTPTFEGSLPRRGGHHLCGGRRPLPS